MTSCATVVRLCFAAATLLGAVRAAIDADEITSLPGWDGPLPSRQYSGYLTVGAQSDRHMHYWYSESLDLPSKDPVVLWMNGGPGATSLEGMFRELGLFALNDNSFLPPGNVTHPKLLMNNHTWNRRANMLYLESPPGVGFSYCDNKETCSTGDNQTASDNYDALVAFFAGFPELEGRTFIITGESYAGIYIPMLVQQIEAHAGRDGAPNINLQGFAIGDGCIGLEAGGHEHNYVKVTFLAGMGMYAQTLGDQIAKTCTDLSDPSKECEGLLSQMSKEAGSFDIYNVFDECGNDQDSFSFGGPVSLDVLELAESDPEFAARGTFMQEHGRDPETGKFSHRRWWSDAKPMSFIGPDSWLARANRRLDSKRDQVLEATAARAEVTASGGVVGGALNDYACGGHAAMAAYLADPAVQTAIHVRTDVPSFPFNYTKTEQNLLPAYPGFIEKYKVMIYSGSVDGCIPFVGTELWTSGLGIPVKTGWEQWTYQRSASAGNIRGGYRTVYDSNDFSYVTVAGAGHMVPTFQPVAAYAMFDTFLNTVEGSA